ncbi:hypothetical protein RQP46_010586 [Phenoliferia psychrophenolica]
MLMKLGWSGLGALLLASTSGSTFKDLLYDHLIDPNSLEGSSWGKHRYFMNVVTFSYTTAFYDWTKWEYLLDWASLHGINLPLAIGGQDFVWREVYRDFGLSEAEIYDWFSGPAFESWQRIHGSWGQDGMNSTVHPVSSDFLDGQWALQKRIIARMVALGMTPVLPAFNGFAPAALHAKVGGPAFLKASNWEGFPTEFTNDTALDPTWSTFATIQSAFLKKQSALYGGWTSHYYSIDLFNELKPYSLESEYLTNNTAAVVSSLRAVDAQAIWVMQGWLFVSDPTSWNATTIPALLAGAKDDEMLILDLSSEAIPAWNKTSSFGGKPWVWSLLHDYGQNQGLYGSLDHYTREIIRAKGNSTSLVGSGITMEGMNQNEVVYELTLDSAWSTSAINVTSWLYEFVQRRYGLCYAPEAAGAAHAHAAWTLLSGSAYNNTNFAVQGVVKSPLELVPATSGIANKTGHHATLLTYDPREVVAALDQLLEAATLINTWNSTSATNTSVLAAGSQITDLLLDIDAVLATDPYFLLSSWIGDAKAWANDSAEVAFLEYQARNQITLWGTASTVPWPLNRYASKQWSGVLSEYYAPGWDQFSKYLASVTPEAYNATAFQTSLLEFEKTWQLKVWGTESTETWGTTGTPFEVIKATREKWADTIDRLYPLDW